MEEKDNSDRPVTAMWIIMIGFAILVVIMMLFGSSACAQDPDLEGYSIEAWEANNAAWQSKYDSLTTVVDSLQYMYENMKKSWLSCLDTSHHYGDHTLIIQDSINNNKVNVSTRGADIWVDYYTDELKYHFFILERQAGNRSFEFWISEYGEKSREIMKMDTSQFRVNYKDLNKFLNKIQ